MSALISSDCKITEDETVLSSGAFSKKELGLDISIMNLTACPLAASGRVTKRALGDMFTPIFGSMQNGMPNFHLNILGFALIFGPIQSILGLFTNFLSRKMEFSADSFSNGFGLSTSLISALKKLAAQNYSNLTPHPLYVIIYYSHPPLVQRIKALLSF